MVQFQFLLVTDCISKTKSMSREKCGILPKGQKYLRKYVCSSLAVAMQRLHDSYPRKPTIAMQRFRNRKYIDGDN
jgi:hypothetical protein